MGFTGARKRSVIGLYNLIDSGMDRLEAVFFIRKERRHAINIQRLKFLGNYKYSK